MSLPILTLAQMREWETATWSGGQTEAEVIRRVGKALAQRVLALTRPNELVLLLAGAGHNGDDVRAMREHLTGRRSQFLNVTDAHGALSELTAGLAQSPALIVDGLFGIGLSRALDADWVKLIQTLNASGLPVIAVDVPSGLNADTGEPQPEAVRASRTITVGAPKQGLLSSRAWPFVGRLEVAAEVGLNPGPPAGEWRWTQPCDFRGFPPPRAAHSHKGTHGHLAIIAGSLGYHGAAVLAARGAQRARPGLVTLFTQEAVYHAIAAQTQAVMVSPWQASSRLPGDCSAVLVGPGLAVPEAPDDLKMTVRRLWRDSALPVVIDASALDWLMTGPTPRGALRVVTPHPGEAARLLRSTVAQVQANRPHAVRELSRAFGHAWVVLKGHQTLVGQDSGEIFVNSSGNPHLGQGGSGDLLAGYVAGLLAQPALQAQPLKTIRFAVWQHGAAADALDESRPNWVVEDLAEAIGGALAESSNHRPPATTGP